MSNCFLQIFVLIHDLSSARVSIAGVCGYLQSSGELGDGGES